jgi:hypothetical protein
MSGLAQCPYLRSRTSGPLIATAWTSGTPGDRPRGLDRPVMTARIPDARD